MSLVLLLGCAFFGALQSVSSKLAARCGSEETGFNRTKALAALAPVAAAFLFRPAFHAPTALFGALYGLSLCAAMLFGYRALALGPLSLTSMIAAFSVLLPIGYGVLFCGETPGIWQGIGLALLCAAIVLASLGKGSGKKAGWSWALALFLTFLANGLCSILQKMHQSRFPGLYRVDFLLFALLCAALFFLLLSLRRRAPARGRGWAALSGCAMAAGSFSQIALASTEQASVLFPAVSAGTIALSLVGGCLIFREKLSLSQIAALCCGAAAVVFLKL